MIKVPAKILLFGEYGLLQGGVGISVTLFSKCFSAHLSEENVEPQNTEHKQFIDKVTDPYLKEYKNLPPVKIENSFPSSYGFGSSSAVIVAHHILWRQFLKLPLLENNHIPADAWQKIKDVLQETQGGGSGYDVASQWMGCLKNEQSHLWKFQLVEGLPQINETKLNVKLQGCILHSEIYASTPLAIKKIKEHRHFETFARMQSQLAEKFLEVEQWDAVEESMNLSVLIAQDMGLFGSADSPVQQLADLLFEQGIPFKLCGAGFGDSFWLGLSKEELKKLSLRHPQSQKPLEDLVLVDFTHDF